MRVRGLPYDNLGVLRNVHVSMGLWRGCPDIDSVMTLAGGQPSLSVTGTVTRVMPSAAIVPLSGYDLAFTRDVACLMYFRRWETWATSGGSTTSGVGSSFQRICRHLGIRSYVGSR